MPSSSDQQQKTIKLFYVLAVFDNVRMYNVSYIIHTVRYNTVCWHHQTLLIYLHSVFELAQIYTGEKIKLIWPLLSFAKLNEYFSHRLFGELILLRELNGKCLDAEFVWPVSNSMGTGIPTLHSLDFSRRLITFIE
jgi:hypothetical protein